MRKGHQRSGFTLPEVLVTVAIVAVLAAVVVPAVVQQVNKGNSPSFLSDINGLRTGVTSFAADTRHFPAKLSQITGGGIAKGTADLFGNALQAADTAGYKGPYISTAQNIATNGYTMAGYPQIIWADNLVKPATTATCGNGVIELKQVTPTIDTVTLHNIDLAVDGLTTNLNTTGNMRYFLNGTTPTNVDSIVYCFMAATQ